jgi:anti-sigma28 factor (negative regulator of flagellin synthesis)
MYNEQKNELVDAEKVQATRDLIRSGDIPISSERIGNKIVESVREKFYGNNSHE